MQCPGAAGRTAHQMANSAQRSADRHATRADSAARKLKVKPMENLLTNHVWLLALAIVAFFAVGKPRLAAAIATDDGRIENVSSYPIDGNWADDIQFRARR